MEKQFNREDQLIKKLLNEAGTEAPSADFKKRIMMRVENRNAAIKPYQPLIPKFVWYVLGVVLVTSVTGLYMMYADVSLSWSFDYKIPRLIDMPVINMPTISLSQTMQYAIAFVALFFLQIPFLKRFLDRQYGL